jgi:antitoxin MazE
MKSNIRKIGNSKGIVIPPAFLAQFKLDKDSDVEIELNKDGILIKPIDSPRVGWEIMFSDAINTEASESDFFQGLSNEFDDKEWTW